MGLFKSKSSGTNGKGKACKCCVCKKKLILVDNPEDAIKLETDGHGKIAILTVCGNCGKVYCSMHMIAAAACSCGASICVGAMGIEIE